MMLSARSDTQRECRHKTLVAWLVVIAHLHVLGTLALAADWPAFRGLSGDGTSHETTVLSTVEDIHLEVSWHRKIGNGYSGVAIAEGCVVTGFTAGSYDVIAAFDEKSGDELWRNRIEDAYVGQNGSHGGPISTPAISAHRVFGLSARGRLFALDIANGKELWSRNLVKEYGAIEPSYGFTTSPVVSHGKLIIQVGGERASVIAFDEATGETKWVAGDDKVSYQSPIIYRRNNRDTIIAAGESTMIGIDPVTGRELYSFKHGGDGMRGAGSITPLPVGPNGILLANKDESSILTALENNLEETVVKPSWTTRAISKSFTTPVYHKGYIYAYNSRFLTCVDAKTGEREWRSRLPGNGYLILVDDHLVLSTMDGTVHIARANTHRYDERASLKVLQDVSWTPPSFANGSIYVRGVNGIAKLAIKLGPKLAHDRVTSTEQVNEEATSLMKALEKKVSKSKNKKEIIDAFLEEHQRYPIHDVQDLLHFVYRAEATDIALAGDLFGARADQSMRRIPDTDLFYYTAKLESDAHVNYIFIKDFNQNVLDPLNEQKTTGTIFRDDLELASGGNGMEMSWVAMPKWKAPAHLGKPIKARRGFIRTHMLNSEILKRSHEITVFLPHEYKESLKSYPVIYVHGGAGARRYGRMTRTMSNLIGSRMTPAIAAFIDVFPGSTNGKYNEVIATEVVTFIDTTYRTLQDRESRANIGAGFRAYNALECTLQFPDVFQKVGSQSLFRFSSMEAMRIAISDAEDKDIFVYHDWGKYDLRFAHSPTDLVETNRLLNKWLLDAGFHVAGGQANDGSGWSSWRNRTDDMLTALFPIQKNE